MGFEYLDIRRRGAIEHLILNRPAVRNAFNEGMITELTWWADSVTADRSVRAVVLEGAGPVFCAGADLEWMGRMAGFTREQNLLDASELARAFLALDRMPVPVVGRVHGAALGGGAGLAGICDVVVAASDAVFGFTEVRLGLIPAVVAPYVLAKIGRSAARELFLTGDRFDAARARDVGLVHSVVPAPELDAEVDRYLDALLQGAPGAQGEVKQLIAEVSRRGAADVAVALRGGHRAPARVRRRPGGDPGVSGEAGARLARPELRSGNMFARVLVANRGEIAVRIIRSCRELGVETVAVYSDADAGAAHVAVADRAVRIGPAPPADSYLRGDVIIDAARREGAEAIHPGYGFLSENAAFAASCADAGLVFVGPPADAIQRMGSKIEARRLVQASGVPVVPGETPDDQSDEAVIAALTRAGCPALVKPAAGGGGIGMRVVTDAAGAAAAVQAARRDAVGAFGDGTLYVERLIARPRHVEFQIFADDHGQVLSLGERECSLQRRHQKVIEESPLAGPDAGAPDRHGRGRGVGGAGVRVPERRNRRVPARGPAGRTTLLFPRDEHAPAGRAPRDRDGARRRPGAGPVDGRRRPAPAVAPGGAGTSEGTRSSAGSTPKIPRPGSCRNPARCCSTASRRGRACASTAASERAMRCRSSTIPCWPSSWYPAKPARRPLRAPGGP